MIENWVKATTTSTSTPYTLAAVSGFPVPSAAFVENAPLSFMMEWDSGKRESGSGTLNSSGNLVVERIAATWDKTTLTRSDHRTEATALSKSGTITVTIHPDAGLIIPGPGTVTDIRIRNLTAIYSAQLINVGGGLSDPWPATADRAYFFPFLLMAPIRVTGMTITWGSSTSTGAVFGFYSCQAGAPDRLIGKTGAINPSAVSGEVSHAWSDATTKLLRPGWYFLAVVHNGSGSILMRTSGLEMYSIRSLFGGLDAISSQVTGNMRHPHHTSTYPELPAQATVEAVTSGPSAVAPIIGLTLATA